MLSKLARLAEGVFGDIEKKARQFAGAASLGRIAAVTAMVAYLPDQDADKDEIKKGIQAVVKRSGGVFEISRMLQEVDKRVKALEFDADMGEGELMQEIERAKGSDEADFLMRVAIAVGKASGEPGEDPFSPEERAVAARIAKRLGLSPDDFGL